MALSFVPSTFLPSSRLSRTPLNLSSRKPVQHAQPRCTADPVSTGLINNLGNRLKHLLAAATISATLLLPSTLATPVQDQPLRLKSSLYPTEQSSIALRVKWEGVRSVNSRTETYVLFENRSNTTIDINWVNYNGYEEIYASMAPGSVHLQPSFATHPWSIRDHVTQESVGQVVAQIEPKLVIMEEEGLKEIQGTKRGESLLSLFGAVDSHSSELDMSRSEVSY